MSGSERQFLPNNVDFSQGGPHLNGIKFCANCGRFLRITAVCVCAGLGGVGAPGAVVNAAKQSFNIWADQKILETAAERSSDELGIYERLYPLIKFPIGTSTSTST